MKRKFLFSGSALALFFLVSVSSIPFSYAETAAGSTDATTAQSTQFITPVETDGTSVSISQRYQENLLTDRQELTLVSVSKAVYLYAEPDTASTRVKLVNQNIRGINEMIVLSEVTSANDKLFYQVRSTFSADTGYVLAKDTRESALQDSGISGFAMIGPLNCSLLSVAKVDGSVLAEESEHLVRILGQIDGYYYVITEGGNFGFVLPAQLRLITTDELNDKLNCAAAPAVTQMYDDPLSDATAANAAKMLRAGADCAAVQYWNTALAHAARQGFLKKATIAMLQVASGTGQLPVGHDGIQYQQCLEVPPLQEGEELQKDLDFNLHGSIYTDSPLISVSANFVPNWDSAAMKKTVTFDPDANITAYSLENSTLPLEEISLDTLFDISNLRAGRYTFTLTAATVAQPDPVVLLSVNCSIVDTKRLILTQNKFDDNYYEALRFFGGNTDLFVFHYSLKDSRSIATENDWRNTNIIESSLGRVHQYALPYFEAANHYLENTYLRVTCVNASTGKTTAGKLLLLKDLIEEEAAYVPRFQSNMRYVSHHTLGTAIDVNDGMYPNHNILSNHDLIGGDVRTHLVYNGIKTDSNGQQYYDFTYDGSYTSQYKGVPKTIVNYLLYELAFYRAGFQWGFYYETACDGMHFMLTENDVNRHMDSDIGLRKVYEYIEPEWTYVPTATPAPDATTTPAP